MNWSSVKNLLILMLVAANEMCIRDRYYAPHELGRVYILLSVVLA